MCKVPVYIKSTVKDKCENGYYLYDIVICYNVGMFLVDNINIYEALVLKLNYDL